MAYLLKISKADLVITNFGKQVEHKVTSRSFSSKVIKNLKRKLKRIQRRMMTDFWMKRSGINLNLFLGCTKWRHTPCISNDLERFKL